MIAVRGRAAGPMRRRRRGRLAAGALIVALVASGVAYGVASYAVYDTLSYVGECHAADAAHTPASYTIPDPELGQRVPVAQRFRMPSFQEVRFHNVTDGLDLAAWWVPAEASDAPAVIVVHGWGTCRRDPNVLLPAGMLADHGFSVMLIDQRDHGDSQDEDRRFAGGTDEYRDVLAAREWLLGRGVAPERIGLLGMSMGTGSVLIAAGADPTVAAVWADSVWPDPYQGVKAFLAVRGYPEILAAGGMVMATLVAGDDLLARTPIAAVRSFDGRPLALVHGDRDWLPSRFAVELRDAAAEAGTAADLWIVPGAQHTEAVFIATAEYETRLTRFFEAALKRPGT